MSRSCCNSVGDASPRSSASTIASRPGSPRAACTAARRATSSLCSPFTDSIYIDLCCLSQGNADGRGCAADGEDCGKCSQPGQDGEDGGVAAEGLGEGGARPGSECRGEEGRGG